MWLFMWLFVVPLSIANCVLTAIDLNNYLKVIKYIKELEEERKDLLEYDD